MTGPAKFLFDTDFGSGRKSGAASAHQGSLAEAEARGFRSGYAAAKAEIAEAEQQTLAVALGRSAAALETLARGLRAVEGRLEAEAVEIAVAVATKLAPVLIAGEPLAEVVGLVTECFRHLHGTPHVVVRVNDAIFAAARERLDEVAATSSFQGRLIVLAEAEIAPGDCRIEWADGGAVRSRAAVEGLIAEAVSRYLAARRPATDAINCGAMSDA
jgi:flagellar assembly protein FliH